MEDGHRERGGRAKDQNKRLMRSRAAKGQLNNKGESAERWRHTQYVHPRARTAQSTYYQSMSVPVFCDELEAVGGVHLAQGHGVIAESAVTYVLDSEEGELVVRVSL